MPRETTGFAPQPRDGVFIGERRTLRDRIGDIRDKARESLLGEERMPVDTSAFIFIPGSRVLFDDWSPPRKGRTERESFFATVGKIDRYTESEAFRLSLRGASEAYGMVIPHAIGADYFIITPHTNGKVTEIIPYMDIPIEDGGPQVQLNLHFLGKLHESVRVNASVFTQNGFDLEFKNANSGLVLNGVLSKLLYDFQNEQGQFRKKKPLSYTR